MATPAVDRFKVWLGQTDLRQKNFALYQLLNGLIDAAREGQKETAAAAGSGGGSGGGITALTTDVVATGPGIAVAIIQNGVVTYAKMQVTAAGDVLLGRADTPGTIQEIALGDNLVIQDGELQILNSDGTLGFAHNLLGLSHPDTIPHSPPDPGDMIVAFENPQPVDSGAYYGFFLSAPIVEDFVGIQFGYYAGYHGAFTPSISMGYSAPELEFIPAEHPETLLGWEFLDFYLLALLIEDFVGIRWGYKARDYVTGNNFGYYPPELDFIVPPTPEPDPITGLWYKIAIGTNGDFLRINNGTPTWVGPATTISKTDTGTVNNLDFTGANIVYLDNASLLTINGITPGPVTPFGIPGNKVALYDGQQVTFISRGAGNVYFAHENTGSLGENRLTNWITSGITPLAAGTGRATYTYDLTANRWKLTEHTQGGMITIPFDAALFTATTGVWTVTAGDVPEDAAYHIDGKTIRLQMRAVTTTTSLATAGLFYTIPNSWTAGRRTNAIGFGIIAAAVESLVTFVSAAGATVISFNRFAPLGNFPAETDTLGAICNIEFDIN